VGDTVELEALGQASVAVRIGDEEIVSDPWVVRKAQLGGWEAYPARGPREIEALRKRVDAASHIFLSHDHADHFDPEFLALLAPKQLVVARFHNARMRSALHGLVRECGHTLHELAPGETLPLGERATLRIIPEQPRFRTNSMLLVQTPHGAVLNANDCGLNSAALAGIARRQRVRVFLYTLNFMANGYPFPYLKRDDLDLRAKLDEVRGQVLASFRAAMQTLQPELSVAFAGPVTFPDRVNEHLNMHPEALDWRRMIGELSSHGAVVWPVPGTRITMGEGALALDQPTTWEALLAQHARQPATRRGPREALDRAALELAARSFLARVGTAVARSGQKLRIALVCSAVASRDEIESAQPLASMRIAMDEPAGFEWVQQLQPPYLQIVAAPSVLAGFLEGTVTLDELLLSAHARFARVPDVFHGTLHNFLRFGHDAEALVALLSWYEKRPESSATIERTVDGKLRMLPKFCPHEGESLESAIIRDGKVVCPRHKWCFEIESGACVAEGDSSVNLYQHVRGS
jgi:UDP-MurNAc hydroxylase